jgi:hypothetical protein
MACCCAPPSPPTCNECCPIYPNEINVSLSSTSPTVCYQDNSQYRDGNGVLARGYCVVQSSFSVSGNVALQQTNSTPEGVSGTFCVRYGANFCITPLYELSVWVGLLNFENGLSCPWKVYVRAARYIKGAKYRQAGVCTEQDPGNNYAAAVIFPLLTITLSNGFCSGEGSATVSGLVGFNGNSCGQTIFFERQDCPHLSGCNSGTVNPSGCSPGSIDLTVALTV